MVVWITGRRTAWTTKGIFSFQQAWKNNNECLHWSKEKCQEYGKKEAIDGIFSGEYQNDFKKTEMDKQIKQEIITWENAIAKWKRKGTLS